MDTHALMVAGGCLALVFAIAFAFMMHLLRKQEAAKYGDERRVYMLTLKLDARRLEEQDRFHILQMEAQKKVFDEQFRREQERHDYEEKILGIRRLEELMVQKAKDSAQEMLDSTKKVIQEMADYQHQAELFVEFKLSDGTIPTKILCGICREDLIHRKGELLKCSCCGVIYHTACVAFNHGRCSTYGCKASKGK